MTQYEKLVVAFANACAIYHCYGGDLTERVKRELRLMELLPWKKS